MNPLSADEMNEFEDDLPKFLLKLSLEELEHLILSISNNRVPKEECMIEMYTIHSYKGLEDHIIRIFNDIDIVAEQNVYYVALTRAKKQIIVDTVNIEYEKDLSYKKQKKLKEFGIVPEI